MVFEREKKREKSQSSITGERRGGRGRGTVVECIDRLPRLTSSVDCRLQKEIYVGIGRWEGERGDIISRDARVTVTV